MTNQLDQFAPAMAKAQSEMPAIEMDGVNPYFKSKYATLGNIIAQTRGILAKHGFSIIQQVISDDHGTSIGIRTVILHESGQSMEWENKIKLGFEGNVMQEAGKACTYLRRYSLAAALNLYSDEDIDANTKEQQSRQDKKRKPADQIIRELGFEPKPKPMAPAEVQQVANRDGKLYVDIPSERLIHMSRSISKAINSNGHDQEQLAELQTKQQAIRTILKSRNG